MLETVPAAATQEIDALPVPSARSFPRRRQVSLAAAAVLGAGVLAPVADAYSYGWTGQLPGGANYACPFYSPDAFCGPYRSDWSYIDGHWSWASYSSSRLHVGFERNSAIRGAYMNGTSWEPRSAVVYRSYAFPGGGNLKPELTNMDHHLFNEASGWFRAHT
jgi:hypothetical protein